MPPQMDRAENSKPSRLQDCFSTLSDGYTDLLVARPVRTETVERLPEADRIFAEAPKNLRPEMILGHQRTRDSVQRSHHAPVLNRPCRPDEREQVGELWNRETQIRFRANFPLILQIRTILAHDREAWFVRDIEPGSADLHSNNYSSQQIFKYLRNSGLDGNEPQCRLYAQCRLLRRRLLPYSFRQV